MNVFSQINSPNGNTIFSYNGNADVTFRYQPRGLGGRAFVHADNNVLSPLYEVFLINAARMSLTSCPQSD
ncbi:hypothetical protein RC62_1062 [Flavobacterium aquidurense]|uniref:Uncharacterized protein n=1 Tax=Flavobacterium aquidurense TaxID=362413 RepID=A0A0Q0WTN0_9FLAO|nr:hypothetical protein RC62_1062 [Flavobacterium aquidurense]